MSEKLQELLQGSTRAAVEADLYPGEPGWNNELTRLELIIKDKVQAGTYYHFAALERFDDVAGGGAFTTSTSASGASLIGIDNSGWSEISATNLQDALTQIDSALASVGVGGPYLRQDGSTYLTGNWDVGQFNITDVKQFSAYEVAVDTADNYIGAHFVYTKTAGATGAAEYFNGVRIEANYNQVGGLINDFAALYIVASMNAGEVSGGYEPVGIRSAINGGEIGAYYGLVNVNLLDGSVGTPVTVRFGPTIGFSTLITISAYVEVVDEETFGTKSVLNLLSGATLPSDEYVYGSYNKTYIMSGVIGTSDRFGHYEEFDCQKTGGGDSFAFYIDVINGSYGLYVAGSAPSVISGNLVVQQLSTTGSIACLECWQLDTDMPFIHFNGTSINSSMLASLVSVGDGGGLDVVGYAKIQVTDSNDIPNGYYYIAFGDLQGPG